MNYRRVFLLFSIPLLVGLTSMLWKQIMSATTQLPLRTSSTEHAIVVGSGLAGLTAASHLISQNVPVHLLERSVKPGGNSIKASSGVSAAPTRFQPGRPYLDTSFCDDTIKSAGSVLATKTKEREKLIQTLTNSSKGAIDWLVDEKGVDLSVVAQLGGHSFPRTHRGAGKTPPGAAIITTLLASLKESPLFQLETSAVVTKVLKGEHGVEGVEYTHESESKTLHGPVIFASGGFAGDAHGMLAEYRPDLAGFPSTNDPRPGSQHLLTEIGAQLLDMDQVQVHPTSFVDPKDPLNPVKFLAAEILRGEGGILLYDGYRFINELETRKVVTEAIMKLPIKAGSGTLRQWFVQLVLDEGAYLHAKSHIDFYLWKGLMQKKTINELGTNSLKSISDHCEAAKGEKEHPNGRTVFGNWALGEPTGEEIVYVGWVTPAVHFTMGGVGINERAEVLGADQKPIGGLWAAGEITGGIHGQNRLGGSSLLECLVFGKIAGDELVKSLHSVS